MAAVNLVFQGASAATLPAHLVFGAAETSANETEAFIQGFFPPLRGALLFGEVTVATLGGTLPGLGGTIFGQYRSDTSRPTVAQTAHGWQVAVKATQDPYSFSIQRSARARRSARSKWQIAAPLVAVVRAELPDTFRTTSLWRTASFQEAQRLGTPPVRTLHSDALRAQRLERSTAWQEALRLRQVAATAWQDRLKRPRPAVRSRWQEAQRLQRSYTGSGVTAGQPLINIWGGRYQDAWPPRPGVYVHVPTEPPKELCYLPELPAHLVFVGGPGDGHLLFICERHVTPPVEPGVINIPVLEVYIVDNNTTLTKLSDGTVIQALDTSFRLDAASWTWSFSATVPPWHLGDLQRPAPGVPVEVQATINGHSVNFLIDHVERDRTYDKATLKVTGRGLNAVLDAPFAKAQVFNFPSTLTAQQLANQILTVNNVPMGWGVDWQMTDWSVPQGAWTPQGTYIQALGQLAAAAGGYVQPHPTARALRFLRKYPQLPRNWGSVTPDFVLPSDAVEVEGLQWVDKPVYDKVYVAGHSGLVVAAKTEGATGTLLAPMISDPLITHVDAGRGRAESVLSDVGAQVMVRLKTLIFPDAGFIRPGTYVRYVDGSVTRIGLTRSLEVSSNYDASWQTIGVETHA